MRKVKKLLSMVMAATMLLTMTPVQAATGSRIDDVTTVPQQQTTAEETADTKTIVYAPSTLMKMDTVSVTHVGFKIKEDDGSESTFDVARMSGGTNDEKNGRSRIYLTRENASNLVSVKAEGFTTNPNWEHFGVIAQSTEEDGTVLNWNEDGTKSGDTIRAKQLSVSNDYSAVLTEFELLSKAIEPAESLNIYWGLVHSNASMYVKKVTAVYNKSDVDKALDTAIAEAEDVAAPSAELSEALTAAKQYKISTTTDIDTAVLATQAEIKSVTDTLTAALGSGDTDKVTVVVQDTDGSEQTAEVEPGKVIVLESDDAVTWTVDDEVLAIGKKLRYTVSGDVTIVARETTDDDKANGIVVGDVADDKVTITYGADVKDTADFTFVTTDKRKATLAGVSISDYKGQTVEYTIAVDGEGITIAYVYAE